MNNFNSWVNIEIEKNGWTYSELARQSGLSTSGISSVMTSQRNPGVDFCVGLARAFGVAPEHVMRIAGLLPAIPENQTQENELLYVFRGL